MQTRLDNQLTQLVANVFRQTVAQVSDPFGVRSHGVVNLYFKHLDEQGQLRGLPSNFINSSIGGLRNDAPTLPSSSKIHESGEYDALARPLFGTITFNSVVAIPRRSGGRLSRQRRRRCWLLRFSDFRSQRRFSRLCVRLRNGLSRICHVGTAHRILRMSSQIRIARVRFGRL